MIVILLEWVLGHDRISLQLERIFWDDGDHEIHCEIFYF